MVDDSRSVFRLPARRRAENEDEEACIKVSLLLSPLEDALTLKDGKESSIPWRSGCLKTLLEVAYGQVKGAKAASRTQLRALRALSLVASPDEIAKYAASLAKPELLGSLALFGIRLGQSAWLEELRLPTQGLLRDGALGEPLARALWRDHRRERLLSPVLVDLLLTVSASSASSSSASSPLRLMEDGELWMGVLRALRDQGHWRDLLDMLPRLSLALGAAAGAHSTNSKTQQNPQSSAHQSDGKQQLLPWVCAQEEELAALWNDALRKPLLELQHRISSTSCEGTAAPPASTSSEKSVVSALPTLASSLVFGSNFKVDSAPTPKSSPPVPPSGPDGSGGFLGGLDANVVVPVLDAVVEGLKTCPYSNAVDPSFFAHTLEALADAADESDTTTGIANGTAENSGAVEKRRAVALHMRGLAKRASSMGILAVL